LISCLFALSIASYIPIFQRDGVPRNSGWSILRRADPEQTLTYHIALPQNNLNILEQKFWENSDPASSKFAQHMTREEITELTAATPQVQKSVLKWIYETSRKMKKGNLLELVNHGDEIEVTSTCRFAEELFKTEMFVFHNDRNEALVIRHMGTLNIPTRLQGDIDFVFGISELPPIKSENFIQNQKSYKTKKAAKRQGGDNQCNNPYTIKELYGIPTNLYITETTANASIFADPGGGLDGFGLASVEDYQNALGLPKNPITCIRGNAANDYVLNDTDLEANLDTEMLTGIAPNANTCFYLMDGWMYEFARQIFATPDAPLVVSMSYGWNEVDSCDNISAGVDFVGNCTFYNIPNSQDYVNLTNILFMKLGLLGHTLIAASGDGGTAGTHGTLNNCETMGPIFPAASPYVLTVGATSIEQSASAAQRVNYGTGAPPLCTDTFYQCVCSTSTNEQVAVSNDTAEFDTGGGFSVYSPQPSFQSKAVQAYLKSGVVLPPAHYFNGNNRGFPDVAGVGENVCLLDPGQPCQEVGGTSASTPLWGGIITLLNNDRIVAGKSPLGYVNQVIYAMFYADSTMYFNNGFPWGNNPGGCPTNMGFNAKAGFWTPLTGCGSPKFAAIRKYVATLP